MNKALAFRCKRGREKRTRSRKPAKILNLAQERNKIQDARQPNKLPVEITASHADINRELAEMILGSELSFDDLVECFNMTIKFIKLKSQAVKHPTITTASGEEKPSSSKLRIEVILLMYKASEAALDKLWEYLQSIREGGQQNEQNGKA